jgi:hypothetical protein
VTVAGIATVTLLVLIVATVVLGAVIVFGRAVRRTRDERRARLSAPGRRAVEPMAVALPGKVRGEAHADTGRIVDTRMPRGRLPRIQVVEYLRAFPLGRTGWSRLGGLRVLARQRRRWHRGITEILTKHSGAIGNPRYGRIGLVALPCYLVFELLAPLVELAGPVLVPLGLLASAVGSPQPGGIDVNFLWRFACVVYGYALLINLVAPALEEYSFHRYSRWRDLGVAVLASALENIGYRQLTAFWRIQGAWSALVGSQHEWGVMTRTGFGGRHTS